MLLKYIGNIRNTVAHNRSLVKHERDILNGISGEVRNLVALYRNSKSPSSAYYPEIESITDNFGNVGFIGLYPGEPVQRLNIGEMVTFDCAAWDSKERTLEWALSVYASSVVNDYWVPDPWKPALVGNTGQLVWTPDVQHVNESLIVSIYLRIPGNYHRHVGLGNVRERSYDDLCSFKYSVNPPE